MPEEISLVDFLPEFFKAFAEQIEADQERWGNVWLQRPIKSTAKYDSQNVRIYNRFDEYWAEYEDSLIDDIPWLKVIGNAYIAWVRLQHPELFPDGDVLFVEE